jgi:hypothetical protein
MSATASVNYNVKEGTLSQSLGWTRQLTPNVRGDVSMPSLLIYASNWRLSIAIIHLLLASWTMENTTLFIAASLEVEAVLISMQLCCPASCLPML